VEQLLVVAAAVAGAVLGVAGVAVIRSLPVARAVTWPAAVRSRGTAVVAAVMGLAFAGVAFRIGADWALPAYLLFAWTLVVVAVIDASARKIPNRLTYPLTPALAVMVVVAGVMEGAPWSGVRALLGGVLAFTALLLVATTRPGSMGMGDVKLAAFIGIGLGYLGWVQLVFGLATAFVLGGVVALALLLLRRKGRRDLLPFGPYLAAGAVLTVVVLGPTLAV
jgi:leader peptidase (prepilin peptidase)/N-methyltransferase